MISHRCPGFVYLYMNGSEEDNALKKIIIADDHPVFRLGLKTALKQCKNVFLAGEAANGPELKHCLEDTDCDLVILDMKMPDPDDGLELLEHIKREYPQIKVIIMSQYYKRNVVEKARQLDVDGYITKEDLMDTVNYVVAQVFAGKKVFSPRIQELLLKKDRIPEGMGDRLTKRELEILKLLVSGCKRKEIADKLQISIPTVDFHKNNIKTKLYAGNLVELIKKSEEFGLV